MAARLVSAFIIILSAFSQLVTGISTIPPAGNGETVVLARRENEANVSVFCRVTNNGSQFGTTWLLTKVGQMRNQIIFPDPNGDFSLVGLSSNLTITSFSRDLNMAILECTNGAAMNSPILETAFFDLRIIG